MNNASITDVLEADDKEPPYLVAEQSKKQQNTCIPLREEPRKGQINGVSNESQTILLPDVGLCEIKKMPLSF